MAESWPYRLLRLLSPFEPESQKWAIREALVATPPCCQPWGIRPLRDLVRTSQDCMSEDFLSIVAELGHQIDFTNFDSEVSHAKMRSSLAFSNGNSMCFSNASLLQLGSSIACYHDHLKPRPEGVATRRGRCARKAPRRKRFCPWNAYVQHCKPVSDGQEQIRDGFHLAALAAKWREMDAAARQPFVSIANAEQAKMQDADRSDGSSCDEDIDPAIATRFRAAWGLGDEKRPLSHQHLCQPAYSPDLDRSVGEWVSNLDRPVAHTPSLPFAKTKYDLVCDSQACRCGHGFNRAQAMLECFFSKFKKSLEPGEMFWLAATGEDSRWACVFLVGHFQTGRPRTCIIARLGQVLETTDDDVLPGVNFPWDFEFRTDVADLGLPLLVFRQTSAS